MSKLKFEIDSEDIFGEYGDPEDYTPIERLIKDGLTQEVKKKIQKDFSSDKFNTITKNIALECTWQVEKKLRNLINEDLVLNDTWGKPTFVGTIEDYLKKQIDKKMLRPVDSRGKTLEGSCSRDNETWLEWYVKKQIDNKIDSIDMELDSIANYECKEAIDGKIKEFKDNGLNKLIMSRLEKAGVS